MTHIPTDQELDDLRNWLKARLPAIEEKSPPPPSEQLLELAWQAAKTHREFLFDHGFYREILKPPMAASDGTDAPFKIDSIGGEWSVTPVRIPGNSNWQKLRWRCLPEYSELYEGRQITATIAGQPYDMGAVFDCAAESFVPGNLDLRRETIEISVEKIVSDE